MASAVLIEKLDGISKKKRKHDEDVFGIDDAIPLTDEAIPPSYNTNSNSKAKRVS